MNCAHATRIDSQGGSPCYSWWFASFSRMPSRELFCPTERIEKTLPGFTHYWILHSISLSFVTGKFRASVNPRQRSFTLQRSCSILLRSSSPLSSVLSWSALVRKMRHPFRPIQIIKRWSHLKQRARSQHHSRNDTVVGSGKVLQWWWQLAALP